jgi:hypothetical protein
MRHRLDALRIHLGQLSTYDKTDESFSLIMAISASVSLRWANLAIFSMSWSLKAIKCKAEAALSTKGPPDLSSRETASAFRLNGLLLKKPFSQG